ncbi:hypothetical protein [Conchiformibius steedae]|uniref:Uncharacterized protein n=1 Tax=Conchiformibius steedae TaxID=153493 RepID=A0A3P2A656_9NEIS|nr:hypothetical protein [Conchiformibius steedae]RRD90921.1 hypothetical protein EII21_02920 [Conchiformibius steedae]
MVDFLSGRSAVEQRRQARKNILTALFIGIVSVGLCSVPNIYFVGAGLLGLLYTVYKGLFKGLFSLWIHKE